MKRIVWLMLLTSFASAQTRVFLEAAAGNKTVPGVDHVVPLSDAAGHDQFMELAKTFLQRCPEVIPTVYKDKADFVVSMNWSSRTRFFGGGKIFHKPDQIIVVNKEGDIIFSGVARSVGGDTEGACKAIMHGRPAQPRALSPRVPEPVTVDGNQPRSAALVSSKPPPSSNTSTPNPGVNAQAPTVEGDRPATAPAKINVVETFLGASSDEKNGERHDGVRIDGVTLGGPADHAGLRAGDYILSIDNHYLFTVDDLDSEVRSHKLGTRVAVRYRRYSAIDETFLIIGGDASTR